MEVGIQESDEGLYRPPVLKYEVPLYPPQMIISEPVQMAVWYSRPEGTLAPVDEGIQESDEGLYRPPVLR